MRRERSQSSDRGRPHVPRWDNPSGQLRELTVVCMVFHRGLLCLMVCQVVFHLLEQFRT